MTHPLFQFGQTLPDYTVPVLNERAVRASAGILFFLAMVSFMNAFLLGNFQPTRVFVLGFLLDFTLRLFVSPRFAPSFIVGQWVVRKQRPEYVGAAQKRFAWAIGFALALTMFYLLVLNNVVGPVNVLVCGLCLLLMFFESAFGICIGCKLYQLLTKDAAQLCPGGVCEMPPSEYAKTSVAQGAVVLVFGGLVLLAAQWVYRSDTSAADPAAEALRCKVPEFAKAMGHEEKWKLHNRCK